MTVRGLALHGTVVDQHVSYRVWRATDPSAAAQLVGQLTGSEVAPAGLTEIVVGENEELPEGVFGDPIDVHVSYLVHRHWDDTDIWVEASGLEAGHVFEPDPALLPSPSTRPAGAR